MFVIHNISIVKADGIMHIDGDVHVNIYTVYLSGTI